MFEAKELNVKQFNTTATTLFDACCSGCLMMHDYAEMAGLESKPVKYYLKATGYPVRFKTTKLYKLTLTDRQGKLHEIQAIGIDSITDLPQQPGIQNLRRLFPQAPEEAFNHPTGEVDLLIGANHPASWRPRKGWLPKGRT